MDTCLLPELTRCDGFDLYEGPEIYVHPIIAVLCQNKGISPKRDEAVKQVIFNSQCHKLLTSIIKLYKYPNAFKHEVERQNFLAAKVQNKIITIHLFLCKISVLSCKLLQND